MTIGQRPRVVIVGGGFGGLWAARALSSCNVDVWLVNRDNYHTFSPLLYQVAAAELEPEEIAYPVRSLTRNWQNVYFVMAEVKQIDFDKRIVHTGVSAISYDHLLLAMGSSEHYLGVPGAGEHAFPLKTLKQAIDLRNHILCCFERAADVANEDLKRRALTFVIVGGGSTGVEFAGALAELVHGSFRRDYPHLDFSKVRIVVLEASDALLPEMPAMGRSYALHRLTRMGVEVQLSTRVNRVETNAVHLEGGEVLDVETVVWTAGVRGVPQAQSWGLPLALNDRVIVCPTLQVEDHPEVFAIGDLSFFEQDGHPLPMIAPVAIQQGIAAAKNIIRESEKQPLLPFRYKNKGAMVTIGRNAAVAYLWNRTFTGFPAWLIWLGVHIFNLIGFRNRLFVLINWARDYFFNDRAVRLILPLEPGACVPGRSDD